MLLDLLAKTPLLGALHRRDADLTMALRLWVVLNKTGRSPSAIVADRLGSARAAAHLHLMMEEIGAAWPEPFCVSPPCCPRLSHDEATVISMVRAGRDGDRPGFDRLLGEMVPADMRDRLFLSATMLGRVAA